MKKELRKWAKEKRATLCVDELSSQIKKHLFSSDIYKNAKNIMCYYSFGSEVSTLTYFEDEAKNWFLPKCYNDELLCCPMNEAFQLNSYGIPEPSSIPIDPSIIDLVIIPALCVDKNGYRIGYGKGYYDRFLKANNKPIKVVISYDELLLDNVFPDEFDEKVDYVVTEKGMFKI